MQRVGALVLKTECRCHSSYRSRHICERMCSSILSEMTNDNGVFGSSESTERCRYLQVHYPSPMLGLLQDISLQTTAAILRFISIQTFQLYVPLRAHDRSLGSNKYIVKIGYIGLTSARRAGPPALTRRRLPDLPNQVAAFCHFLRRPQPP